MQATVGGEVDELSGLVGSLSGFARGLDPDALVPGDAVRLLAVAARGESILATIKGLAGLRVDDTQAWRHAGFRSAADYAASKTGTTRAAAKEALDTARKARDLPSTDEAMRNGDLTARQAKEVADAATADPRAERGLLSSAERDDFSSFKDKARRAKAAADPDPEARARRIHRERSLRHWTDPEGVFCAVLRTTPEAGARFLAGLEPHRRAIFDHARQAGRREAPEAYLADALDHLATAGASGTARAKDRTDARERHGASSAAPRTEGGVAGNQSASDHRANRTAAESAAPHNHDATPVSSSVDRGRPGTLFDQPPGDLADRPATSQDRPPDDEDARGGAQGARSSPDQPTRPPGTAPPASRSAPPPTTVHLNIDLAALQRGRLQPGDTCEIPGIGPINLTTARALLGDATVKLIINHQTQLSDLARLCKHHHHLKTHEGYTYTGGPGTWTWHPPNPATNSSTSQAPNEQTDAA